MNKLLDKSRKQIIEELVTRGYMEIFLRDSDCEEILRIYNRENRTNYERFWDDRPNRCGLA